MTTPVPPASPAGQRSGCTGCARGCGIALLVLLVALVLAGVAAWTFGRPWLAAQLPALEARQPLLTPLLDYTGLRARLVPAPTGEEPSRERVPGENDRGRLPADILVYDAPIAEAYSIGAAQVTAFQRVHATPEEAAAFFREGMALRGWELVLEREIEDGRHLGWTRDGRTCQVEIVASERHTEIWLRSDGQP